MINLVTLKPSICFVKEAVSDRAGKGTGEVSGTTIKEQSNQGTPTSI